MVAAFQETEVKTESEWMDVGIIRGSVCTVQCYYKPGGLENLLSYSTPDGELIDKMPSGEEIKWVGNGRLQGLLYHRTCVPDFLCSWPSLNSYLK